MGLRIRVLQAHGIFLTHQYLNSNMDLELLMEYDRFLSKGRTTETSPEEVIRICFENGWNQFIINQEMIDANPRFLELVDCSKEIKKLEITGVINEDLAKHMPFEKLSNIEQIRFWGCNINGFFKHTNNMPNLKDISINITHLPSPENQKIDSGISNLKSLENLDIIDYNITYLPDSIGDLTNLKYLRLHTSAYIPMSITNLTNLYLDIALDKSQESYIRNLLSKMKGLEGLKLTSGNIESIPLTKSQLTLERLNLEVPTFKKVPETIRQMKSLKSLSLCLDIPEIPYWLTELQNLEYLFFGILPDHKLPLFLKELPNLKHIDLFGLFLTDEEEEQISKDFEGYELRGINTY
jgi:hypothetical protein